MNIEIKFRMTAKGVAPQTKQWIEGYMRNVIKYLVLIYAPIDWEINVQELDDVDDVAPTGHSRFGTT